MFSPVALVGIAIMSCVMSVAVLGSLLRASVQGLTRWFAAYSILTLAFLLLLIGPTPQPPLAAIVGANVLLIVAAFMILQGTRQFFGRPATSWLECAGVGALLVGVVHGAFVSPDLSVRVAITSGFFGYVRVVISWMACRLRPANRPRYSYWFVSGAALAGALVHLARFFVYGFGHGQQTSVFDPSALNVTFLGLGILSLPCLSIGMVMLAHDRLAQRMERLATIDELTGAFVRRAFFAQAQGLLSHARAAHEPLSVAILDLDHFKSINDRFGHAAGDQALASFAAVIQLRMRPGDLFGRLGGEEFALVFPDTGKDEAIALTNALRIEVETSLRGEAACTFSAGVEACEAGDTLTVAMARADAALYAAKAMGRNCVMMASGSEPAAEGLDAA
ncbi:GGDEF domain-containing protein [Trinickia fusca]|uniref:diguanylate cyclase n=1 Tax=Trinickia fusca TaxID=2419777 RepID=A0A494XF28_9BURK|nr:GGDEF domain-containing protein [Trinickia fusca]RKP49108.1 GGDEF domain-containing protein [Trinickia fusca]